MNDLRNEFLGTPHNIYTIYGRNTIVRSERWMCEVCGINKWNSRIVADEHIENLRGKQRDPNVKYSMYCNGELILGA